MKKGLSAKGWLVSFIAMLLLIVMLWAGFNVLTDPFGAFGSENAFTWWSYEETLNPRVAKISYLDKHHDLYDSYALGASTCSSWPKEDLDRYLGANFYNLINYGMDSTEMQMLAEYIIDNYTVKNLVLSVDVGCGDTFGEYEQTLTYSNHYKVNHSSALAFYTKYLFADPANGIEKLKTMKIDSIIPKAYDCFDEYSGAYHKIYRDIEPIGELKDYVSRDAYSVFADYPTYDIPLPYIDQMAEAVSNIRALCEEKGINLLVLGTPVYKGNLDQFTPEAVAHFEEVMAQAAGDAYHSFTVCPGSDDPRFFYDATHFRNALGSICLSNVFENESRSAGGEAELPVLMYHSITENGNAFSLSPQMFEEHIQAILSEGYTPVSVDQLISYAGGIGNLPEKPILITFDDGYENNYTDAFPILEKYNVKAVIFPIGKSVGRDVYVDGKPMTPHFTLEQAKKMLDSGLITIGSHTFNMHQVEGRDEAPVRKGVLQYENETEAQYWDALTGDIEKFSELFDVVALSYPEGKYTDLAALAFSQSGIKLTCTSDVKLNTIVKGLPQSLYGLGRYDVDAMNAVQLLEILRDN